MSKCSDVWRHNVLGEGGSGLGGLGSLATRCGATFGFATGCGGGVGRSSSTGAGMGSTFTFLRGARSLLPAGLPFLGAGASMVSCAIVGGIVSALSRIVVEFSTIVVVFSEILASASATFEIKKHFFNQCTM